MCTQWQVKGGLAASVTNQMRAEGMGLVDKGDKYGAIMYPTSGAADHYLSWDTKTRIQKDDLLEKFKAAKAEVCVSPLRQTSCLPPLTLSSLIPLTPSRRAVARVMPSRRTDRQ